MIFADGLLTKNICVFKQPPPPMEYYHLPKPAAYHHHSKDRGNELSLKRKAPEETSLAKRPRKY